MNRRELLRNTLLAAGAGLAAAEAGTVYVNVETGADTNPGTKQSPLRSLEAAVSRVNERSGLRPAD